MKRLFINLSLVAIFIFFISNLQTVFALDDTIIDDDINDNDTINDDDTTTDDDINDDDTTTDDDINDDDTTTDDDLNDDDDEIIETTENDALENDEVDDNNDMVENVSYGLGGTVLGSVVTVLFLRKRRVR